MDQVAKRHSIV